MARKSAHGKSGAESLSIRISGRLKYALELIARQQRRTLSSLAEWAFEDLVRTQSLRDIHGETQSWAATTEQLWDPIEADRVVKLARHYPHLLTYEEDLIWKVIGDEERFWNFEKTPMRKLHEFRLGGSCMVKGLPDTADEIEEYAQLGTPNMKHIREQWEKIKAKANGEPADFTQANEEG